MQEQMAPMKRPASSAHEAHHDEKKTKRGHGVFLAQCKELAAAIKEGKAFPEPVLKMLSHGLEGCFGAVKEERHSFQEQVVEMVETVLQHTEASMTAEIENSQAKVDGSVAEANRRQEFVTAAEQALALCVQSVATAQSESEKADAASKEALKELELKKADQKVFDEHLQAAASNKEKLEKALAQLETTVDARTAKELVKVGKDFSLDSSMLSSLPSCLSKAVDARGPFDAVVVKEFQEKLKEKHEAASEELRLGATGQEERAAAVAVAQASFEAAAKAKSDALEVLKAAQDAQKKAEAENKAAATSLKHFGPEMKKLAHELKALRTDLKLYKDGPMVTFKALAERTNIKAPEPEVHEEVKSMEAEVAPDVPAAPDAAAIA